MKYYMITFKGCFGDGSIMNQTVWVAQDSTYFDGDAFFAVIHDEFSEGDENFAVAIFFMRDCSEIEYEVNKSGQKNQSQ